MSLAVSLASQDTAARLRRQGHEAADRQDMRLWGLQIKGYDGCADFLGRFKRVPTAPPFSFALRSPEFAERDVA